MSLWSVITKMIKNDSKMIRKTQIFESFSNHFVIILSDQKWFENDSKKHHFSNHSRIIFMIKMSGGWHHEVNLATQSDTMCLHKGKSFSNHFHDQKWFENITKSLMFFESFLWSKWAVVDVLRSISDYRVILCAFIRENHFRIIFMIINDRTLRLEVCLTLPSALTFVL